MTNWPETSFITNVEFTPGNFVVRHTKEGKRADSWPGVHIPGWGNGSDDPGNLQWTLYIVIPGGGGWVTAPCILFYPEDPPTLGVNRGGPAPFSNAAKDWYYQEGGMAGRQPVAGQLIGVLAVAGAWRGLNVPSISERSNVCWITVPPNDAGTFAFAPPAPPAPPNPPEQPAPPVPTAPPAPPPPPPPPPPSTSTSGAGSSVTTAQIVGVLVQLVTVLERLDKKLDKVASQLSLDAFRKDATDQVKAIGAALTGGSGNSGVASLLKLFKG